AVAVLRVDIGLYLEHKAGDFVLVWRDGPRPVGALSRLRARRRSQLADPVQQFAHPEIIQRTAEIDRGQMPAAIGRRIEGRAETARHLDLLAQLGERLFGQTASQLRVVETTAAYRLDHPVVDTARKQPQRIGEQIISAEKVAPHADWPGGRG